MGRGAQGGKYQHPRSCRRVTTTPIRPSVDALLRAWAHLVAAEGALDGPFSRLRSIELDGAILALEGLGA